MINTTFLDKSLYAAAKLVLTEEAHKPTPEDAKANRDDPMWSKAFNIHGSSSMHPDTTPDKMNMQHLFCHPKTKKWIFGIKEMVSNNGEPHEVKSMTTNHHFIDRISDENRNIRKVDGSEISKMKQRIVDKVNELKLVGTTSYGVDYREQHFESSTNQKTKGHTIVTHIHKNGNIEFKTFYNDVMANSVGNHMKTLVESIREQPKIYID